MTEKQDLTEDLVYVSSLRVRFMMWLARRLGMQTAVQVLPSVSERKGMGKYCMYLYLYSKIPERFKLEMVKSE